MSDTPNFQGTKENFDSVRALLVPLRPDQLRHFPGVTTDVIAASMRVYASMIGDAARFAAVLVQEEFSVEMYSNLPARVGAFWYADSVLSSAIDPKGVLRGLVAEAKPLHAKMLRAADYVFGLDPVLGPVVREIQSGRGAADMADDLNRTSVLFTEHKDMARDKCAVTDQDVANASRLGQAILGVLKPSKETDVSKLKEQRARAAEFLRLAIEHIRSAAAYLYRGDMEAYKERYPSIFERAAHKTKRAKGEAETKTETSASETPA